MVRMISDSPSETKRKTHRRMTFEFEYKNENDIALIKKIESLCAEQPRCENCVNFCHEGCFGSYMACSCKIHGILESLNNPHHDMDGSKCKEYNRKEN